MSSATHINDCSVVREGNIDSTRVSAKSGSPSSYSLNSSFLNKVIEWIIYVINTLNDRKNFGIILLALLVFDTILSFAIIRFVKYTEIDWVAYMQEVKGFLDGEFNYMNLRGDTGPLVYPAGFVYIYSVLYYLTDYGTNVLRAQYIFSVLYILCQAFAALCLHESRLLPTLAIVPIFFSKRLHSIFLLRCFNDGVAMLLFYMALLLFLRNRWSIGCLVYSLAVSVKMNVLLTAPGVLVLLLQRFGVWGAVAKLSICAVAQLLLALPFLATYPMQYLQRAFDFGRVFDYQWTVNLKFLPPHVFTARPLALLLLLVLLLLLTTMLNQATQPLGGLVGLLLRALRFDPRTHVNATPQHPAAPALVAPVVPSMTTGPRMPVARALAMHRAQRTHAYTSAVAAHVPVNTRLARNVSPERIAALPLLCNFLGVLCARSLHYQFYSWYAQSLPLLLALTPLPLLVRVALLASVEWLWCQFPASAATSLALLGCHLALLAGLWRGPMAALPLWEGADECSCCSAAPEHGAGAEGPRGERGGVGGDADAHGTQAREKTA